MSFIIRRTEAHILANKYNTASLSKSEHSRRTSINPSKESMDQYMMKKDLLLNRRREAAASTWLTSSAAAKSGSTHPSSLTEEALAHLETKKQHRRRSSWGKPQQQHQAHRQQQPEQEQEPFHGVSPSTRKAIRKATREAASHRRSLTLEDLTLFSESQRIKQQRRHHQGSASNSSSGNNNTMSMSSSSSNNNSGGGMDRSTSRGRPRVRRRRSLSNLFSNSNNRAEDCMDDDEVPLNHNNDALSIVGAAGPVGTSGTTPRTERRTRKGLANIVFRNSNNHSKTSSGEIPSSSSLATAMLMNARARVLAQTHDRLETDDDEEEDMTSPSLPSSDNEDRDNNHTMNVAESLADTILNTSGRSRSSHASSSHHSRSSYRYPESTRRSMLRPSSDEEQISDSHHKLDDLRTRSLMKKSTTRQRSGDDPAETSSKMTDKHHHKDAVDIKKMCLQLTTSGTVVLCSTTNPRSLPDFSGALTA